MIDGKIIKLKKYIRKSKDFNGVNYQIILNYRY